MQCVILYCKYYWRVYIKYGLYAVLRGKPRRYSQLLQALYNSRLPVILEVGVYNGLRAKEMIETARIRFSPSQIQYYGFDLFQTLSAELLQKEYSKQPSPIHDVQTYLEQTEAQIHLYPGFTQNTLLEFAKNVGNAFPATFVFIDGGHDVETIRSDWQAVSGLVPTGSIVLFDDYYTSSNNAAIAEIGCQAIINTIPTAIVLPIVDSFERDFGTQHIQFALVKI